MDEELPIGSCHKGYYVIEKQDELESMIDDLRSRIVGMIERMQSIENAYEAI